MNPIIDTLMVILMVMLLIYLLRGYHLNKLREREEGEHHDSDHH